MKHNIVLALASAALLCSCGNNSRQAAEQGIVRQADSEFVTYLVLSKVGQYSGGTVTEKDDTLFLENFVKFTEAAGSDLPGESAVTSSSGAKFLAWVSYDGTGALTKHTKVPAKSGQILYAYFEGGGEADPTPTPTPTPTPSGAHGPDGSTKVSWYLCGSGSLWDSTGWTTAGGVQLFSNPASATDLGCILSVTFAVGDEFKVTNGTNWYGYDKVDQSDGGSTPNAGKTCFEGKNDGYSGSNISCKTAGTYDIYVNKDGKFWIQASN